MSPTSLSEMYPADIKQEPSGPASTTGVDEPASEAYQHPPPSFTALTAATSSSHEAQLPNPGVTRAGSKRKRPSLEVSETPEASGDLNPSGDSVLPIQTPIVPRQPALILATRNFPRTTAPLLNAIGAHRFASLFAAPVKEKAAPGYRETIYQPQDLKSIKAAIAHGSRAVAAAAASLSDNTSGVGASPSQAGTPLPRTASGGTLAPLWLPPNPDIVPPKGIVNSAQLEKELLRMFANAVMYNPEPRRGEEKSLPPSGNSIEETSNQPKDDENDEHDDDEGSVVKDAREMFQVVEKIITDWRAAERTAALDMGPTPLPDRPANAVRARSNNSHPSMGWDGAGDMEENSAAMSVKGEDAPDETLIESVEQQAEPGREGEGED
ncbi:MAG: hypothetical protein M1826_001768 [Phylliscum demangeonii]|nr:MAG: hypothetical protein M1826_001768 [Phylliscum demangeonii]